MVLSKMNIYTLEKNNEKVAELNEYFHVLIRKAARNDYITQQIKAVRSFDSFFRKKALAHTEELEKAYKEHRLIFKCIEENKPEEAEETIRNHIYRTTKFVKAKAQANKSVTKGK